MLINFIYLWFSNRYENGFICFTSGGLNGDLVYSGLKLSEASGLAAFTEYRYLGHLFLFIEKWAVVRWQRPILTKRSLHGAGVTT